MKHAFAFRTDTNAPQRHPRPCSSTSRLPSAMRHGPCPPHIPISGHMARHASKPRAGPSALPYPPIPLSPHPPLPATPSSNHLTFRVASDPPRVATGGLERVWCRGEFGERGECVWGDGGCGMIGQVWSMREDRRQKVVMSHGGIGCIVGRDASCASAR
jgi:hypothetical protein